MRCKKSHIGVIRDQLSKKLAHLKIVIEPEIGILLCKFATAKKLDPISCLVLELRNEMHCGHIFIY